MEIMGNLWQVGGAEYTSVEDAAIYLIRFGEKAALIDAGCGGAHDSLAANISDILPPDVEIEYLFLTHCHYDHTGGAAAVRDQFGCRIVAHELDASFLEDGDSTVTAANWYDARMEPLKIDIKIKNIEETFKVGAGRIVAHHCPGHSPGSVVYLAELGSNLVIQVTAANWYGARMNPLKIDTKIKERKQTFQVGSGELTAYHCPGHSPGSVVYLAKLKSNRVLFGQDVHGPLDASFLSHRDDYICSLNFMMGLEADILCEGHFGVYQGKNEVNQFIRTYLDG